MLCGRSATRGKTKSMMYTFDREGDKAAQWPALILASHHQSAAYVFEHDPLSRCSLRLRRVDPLIFSPPRFSPFVVCFLFTQGLPRNRCPPEGSRKPLIRHVARPVILLVLSESTKEGKWVRPQRKKENVKVYSPLSAQIPWPRSALQGRGMSL